MWNRVADWLIYGPPPPDPPPNARKLSNRSRQRTLDAKRNWVAAARQILSDRKIASTDALFQIYESSSDGRIHTSSGSFIGLRRGAGEDRLSITERQAAEKMEGDLLDALAQSLIDHYLVHLFPDLLTSNSIAAVKEVRMRISQRADEIAHSRHFPSTVKKEEEMSVPVRPLATGSTARQYFASSLSVSSTGDGLMVGSPGSGRVGGPQEGIAQLMLDPSKTPSASKSTVTFYGGRGGGDTTAFPSYERFGWASAPCDANGDGIEDWVICAPSYAGGRDTEAAHGNYTGRCDIFFGPFKSDLLEPQGQVPDVSIYGDRMWGNFGLSVVTGDVDGDGRSDIVISAPYAGR
jgi:hypothetical protein